MDLSVAAMQYRTGFVAPRQKKEDGTLLDFDSGSPVRSDSSVQTGNPTTKTDGTKLRDTLNIDGEVVKIRRVAGNGCTTLIETGRRTAVKPKYYCSLRSRSLPLRAEIPDQVRDDVGLAFYGTIPAVT